MLWVLGEVFRARTLDWLQQLCIDTATWGYCLLGTEYGVTPLQGESWDDRRARVKAKMRGAQTTTRDMLAGVAAALRRVRFPRWEELAREHRVRFRFASSGAFPRG